MIDNKTSDFDEFNNELKKLELFKDVVTADINDSALNKIKKEYSTSDSDYDSESLNSSLTVSTSDYCTSSSI